MKIACVSTYDVTARPRARRKWTNVRGYYQAQSLQNQGVEIEYFQISPNMLFSLSSKVKYLYYRLQNRRYLSGRDRFLLMYYARELSKWLSKADVDLVFSPWSWQPEPVTYLECDQPIVIWTDATFKGHMDDFGFNPYWRRLCKETLRDSWANERSLLSRCSLAIYASDWAAQTAIKNYRVAKVEVVPFGPYLERNMTAEDINRIVNDRSRNECKLLFIGTNWQLKGGNLALKVARELNRRGLKTTLTMVGCKPDGPLPSFARPLGFVNSLTQEGLDMIAKLYAESHFLIVPSLIEGFGVVFAEASSFGVPSLATNVGGIPTAIKDGLNGKTFPLNANAGDYCDYVLNLFSNFSNYKELALSSFNQYQSRLNWSVAGKTVKTLMMQLLK
jgi:glycosyltransferase involved in cell wall biosynthesis